MLQRRNRLPEVIVIHEDPCLEHQALHYEIVVHGLVRLLDDAAHELLDAVTGRRGFEVLQQIQYILKRIWNLLQPLIIHSGLRELLDMLCELLGSNVLRQPLVEIAL